MRELVTILAGYLIGSIPFGFLLVRLLRHRDIRELGSGNAGATNVLRATGPAVAGLVLALDVLKGALPVLLGLRFGASTLVIGATAFAAALGHIFPVYIGFRGGKGVATALGAFSVLALGPTLVAIGVLLAIVAWKHYVSLGSMAGVGSAPLLMAGAGAAPEYTVAAVSIAALVISRHTGNIRRLLAGSERRLGDRLELQ